MKLLRQLEVPWEHQQWLSQRLLLGPKIRELQQPLGQLKLLGAVNPRKSFFFTGGLQ